MERKHPLQLGLVTAAVAVDILALPSATGGSTKVIPTTLENKLRQATQKWALSEVLSNSAFGFFITKGFKDDD